jgi:anthranilate 1,2-dioxygenase small subunit
MTPNPTADRAAIHDLLAQYGALLDGEQYDEWLDLFAPECRYNVIPRENYERGLPAALIFCDSRAMLEDRIRALREANKFNIHNDRHLIGLPRIIGSHADGLGPGDLEIEAAGQNGLKIRDKLILLDTFAVPSLLATPL